MSQTKPHLPAPDLSKKIQALRTTIQAMERDISELDDRIIDVRSRMDAVRAAKPSRAEFVEYAMASMRDQASAWQSAAEVSIGKAAIASAMTPITSVGSINGAGEPSFTTSQPGPVCPLAPNQYGGTETSLQYTAWGARTSTPAVALLAIMGPTFEEPLRAWLLQRAEAVGLPAVAEMPLSERSAQGERLQIELETLIEQRATMLTAIGEIKYDACSPLPRHPDDAVMPDPEWSKQLGLSTPDKAPTVTELLDDGRRVVQGHDRWATLEPASDDGKDFDRWLQQQDRENREAEQQIADGSLF